MHVPNGHRRKPRRKAVPITPDELEAELRRYAVKLFDMGDGRAVDWPMVAKTLFAVGFGCLDEVKGDPRAAQVLRKFDGGVYNRLVGNPDDGTPYTEPASTGGPPEYVQHLIPGQDFTPKR